MEEDLSEQDDRLGASLHTFTTKVRASKAPKRAIEATGVVGAVLVPVGLAVVEGVVGIVVAVFGGLVALTAYLLSSRQRKKPPGTRIEVFEKGIVCSQADASRTLLWNEIIDITNKRIQMPDGTPVIALVFEAVADPPLLIMVGGSFSDESETAKLLDCLRDVWIPVWCRRAKVLAQHGGVTVGAAIVRCDCLAIGKQKLTWESITGVVTTAGAEQLTTQAGDQDIEGKGASNPFPSAARRVAALAKDPPTPALLPPARRDGA